MHSFLSKCPPMKSEIEYFKLYKMQEKNLQRNSARSCLFMVLGFFFKQIYLWNGDGESFAHRFVFLKKKPAFSHCQYCALQTVKIKRSDFPERFN